MDTHRGVVADLIPDRLDDEIIALVADFDRLPDMRQLTAVLDRIRLA